MRQDDFFTDEVSDGPWSQVVTTVLDSRLVERIGQSPLPEHPDIEVAVALAHLTHDQFEIWGTSKEGTVGNENSRLLLSSLSRVLKRLGVEIFEPPFRDFASFERYWKQQGASGTGGWAARTGMLHELFEPLHQLLQERENASMDQPLATGISPHAELGWPSVDQEIAELRRHFNSARSEQDYSNIGNDCVAILEALSAVVYVHEKHGAPGYDEPPVDRTKIRFERYIEVECVEATSKELRKLATSSIELAQAVKHRRETATRVEAGIAADAVILLANIFRRLQGKA